jgi:hypothetical protein
MGAPPSGISEADWSSTPVGVRGGFLELLQHGQEQQQEIEKNLRFLINISSARVMAEQGVVLHGSC